MQPLLLLILAAAPPGGGDPLWWVFFADRGPMAAERVAEAAALLAGTARAERRLAAGVPLASELDLPPWPAYVEEVALLAGSVPRTESRLLDAVSIEADEEEIAAVSCLPFVAGVRPVARSAWTPVSPGPAPAGAENFSAGQLCQAGVGTLIAHGYTGSGTVVGILDTGFNLWHTALADAEILDQYDFLDDDPDPSQQEGDPPGQANHGTAVLSIIAADEPGIYTGGARGASFLLAKTEDTSGEYQQEEDFWVAGLEWLEQEGADLVSSSLGYIDWYGYEDLDGGTAVTTIAADLAASLGMPVVNAIGNNGPAPGTLIAPADGDSVFAVGGVDEAGTLAYFSSRGPTADGRTKPDACAAGVNVVFISPEGQTGYSSGNGTSFATPIVSSAVALLLEAHPEWSSLDALDALRATASQAGAPDDDLGWGIIDADAACRWRSVTG
ncbi:S8 family serine peptidase, partial [Candidatus Fermentibacteria bacterium]|nr:S8 family serine peptidase [Candidatus Fermentibacteria bacterium]